MTKKIAIIGAGITGLSAAYYLKKEYPQFDVEVIEATNRAGGKIQTYRKEGYTIEFGPESYLGRKKIMTELAEEIGLGDDLITNQTGQSYIYANNHLYPIPGGSIMGIPTDVKPFISTKLISVKGKIRAAMDLFKKPVEMQNGDISVGHFFRERLGDEVLENLIEPLMGGIYGTNIDDLSLMSTFPNFKEREEQYNSLIKGMRHEKQVRQSQKKLYPGAPKGQFKQFRHGLSSFIEALEQAVKKQDTEVIYNTKVEDIIGSQRGYDIVFDGEKHFYDGVLVTVPHQTFMQWFSEDPAFDYFKAMDSTSVATVVLAFDEKDVENTYDGTGFVIARTSDTRITACTWTSKKWPFTTPKGKVLLRAYVGKPGDHILEEMNDEQIVSTVRKDLSQMMTIKGNPEFTIVNRLPKSMPQYHVGHIQHVRDIQTHIRQNYPHLRITGAGFEAVGLPDCIQQGKDAIEELAAVVK